MKNTTTENTTGTLSLAVLNSTAADMPNIYVNTVATLCVALVNDTGSGVQLQNGSSMEVYMPYYFTAAEVSAMQVEDFSMQGWSYVVASDGGLLLSFSGNGIFQNGAVLQFNITNVVSASSPASDAVQINFTNFIGQNVPLQTSAPLGLLTPVAPGNASLEDVLLPSLNSDVMFVSVAADPLSNSLFLNLKNTGTTPLYNGASLWTGTPKITVSFAYGNTSGALTTDQKSSTPPLDSAWNIGAAVVVAQTSGWTVENPSLTGNTNSPAWTLAPANTNQQIIGIETEANITFEFSNIYSFTPPGSTQMYIQFTGFQQDETTVYNDFSCVLDIDKQTDPPRGLTALFDNAPVDSSNNSVVYTTATGNETGEVTVPLGWEGAYIGKVVINYDISDQTPAPPSPFNKLYADNNFPGFDSCVLSISGVKVGDQLNFTMSAYQLDGVTLLNNFQTSILVVQQPDAYTFTCPQTALHYLGQPASITLNWSVFDAVSIAITANVPGVTTYSKTYASPNQWNNDSATVSVPPPSPPTPITFTLNAYDSDNNLLNSMHCTVASLTLAGWIDPADSKVYTVVNVNNQTWMAQNYDRNLDALQESTFYNYDPSNETQYARLYTQAAAISSVPQGWRLPTVDDWQNLINSFGGGVAATQMMMIGNPPNSGLNLAAGGFFDEDTSSFLSIGSMGAYWAAPVASDPANIYFMLLAGDNPQVTTVPVIAPALFTMLSVRFVLQDT